MIICKQPKIGAKVPVHTDSTFLYTHPASAVGFWIALENVTETNGALSFLPGSHRDPRNSVSKRFVRMKSRAEGGEGGTGFVPWNEVEGREQREDEQGKPEVDWEKEEGWELAPCTAGSLVLIHGKQGSNLFEVSRGPDNQHSNSQETFSISLPTICPRRLGSSIPFT
jgi:phytanoyl-CoA hydroxylase